MQLRRQSDNQAIRLESDVPLGRGGEATIYRVVVPAGMAAKVYHNPSEARARKLAVMLATPPDDPTQTIGHTSLTWPNGLLVDTGGSVVGFLMPRVEEMRPVFTYYNPLSRRRQGD